jgi:hypothetical protein
LPYAIDEKAFSLPNDAKKNQRRKKESTTQKGMFAITTNDGFYIRQINPFCSTTSQKTLFSTNLGGKVGYFSGVETVTC